MARHHDALTPAPAPSHTKAPEGRVMRLARSTPGAPELRRPAPATGGLAALRVARIEGEGEVERVFLQVGDAVELAIVDPVVHPVVLRAAFERGERIIAQREGGRWVVLGSLRTEPIPGIDPGDEYVIRARRIAVLAEHELSLVSGAASLVLRAFGHVETIAQDITTRASSVHKIIGRVIRLN